MDITTWEEVTITPMGTTVTITHTITLIAMERKLEMTQNLDKVLLTTMKSTIMSMHMIMEMYTIMESTSMIMSTSTIMATAMAQAKKIKKKRRTLMLRAPICTYSEIC